jgi:hypothetical protein
MPHTSTRELLREKFPELVDCVKGGVEGNGGLISTDKAWRFLGWKEVFDNSMK